MADRQNENSRLMDYPGGRKYSADEKRNGEAGTVVQLRDWLDDPYEQVSELPSQKYASTDDGKIQLSRRTTTDSIGDNIALTESTQPPIRLAKVAALSSLMLVSLITSMFYVEESKDSYLMTSCRSAMNSIDIEDVSYCNRLAIEIVGNIDPMVYTEPQNGTIWIKLLKKMQKGTVIIDDPVFIKPTEAVTTKIKDMTKIEHLFTIDSLKGCDSLSLIAEPSDASACASVNLSYHS